MTIREALIAMGYREVEAGIWLKPVGYHLFSYHEGRERWQNWFLDIQGAVSLYETQPLHGENALSNLKTYEAYTRINIGKGDS